MNLALNRLFIIASLSYSVLFCISCKGEAASKDSYTDTAREGTIPVAIDESLRPIIDLQIQIFENQNIEAEIKPIYCDEERAIELLLKDSVRVAITTRMLFPKEKKDFDDRRWPVHQEKIASDGIALITHLENQDSLISIPQIRKILTGEVTSWNQLNPTSKLGNISVAFDHTHSGTVRYVRDSICEGKPFASQGIYAQKTNRSVFDYVTQTPGAIGIIGVAWLDNSADTTNTSFKAGVRVMQVGAHDPVDRYTSRKPYQAYLALKSYPLVRDIYVLCSDPRQALSANFTHFLTTDKGQRVILKAGLVPANAPLRLVHIKNEY